MSYADNETTSVKYMQSRLIFPEGHFGKGKRIVYRILTGKQPDPGGLKGSGLFLFKVG